MSRILIVAYGNPLRCDDGVAWRATKELQSKFPESDVEILRQHQLAPEVADALRNRALVLFLDAACSDDADTAHPGEIRICEIANPEIKERLLAQFSHVYSPAKILELARDLYGVTPSAYVITVAGQDFSHGEHLSQPVGAALPSLVATVERIVRAHLSNS